MGRRVIGHSRVPRSVWINHIGERLYFKWYAIDNDFDRLNDWLRADSPEYTGPMIADDDTAGPSFSNPASSYIAATGAFRIQIDVTDPSGISMVRFWCTLDYSWHVPTGSSGNTYWCDIPYGTWSPYSGQTFNWYAGAGDSDNDRPWDRADSYSSVYDATLPLLPSYGVDTYINPSTAVVAPGSSISYTVNVHNTGNIEDTYSLKLNGLDTTWYTFSTASVTVGAGQIVQVTLTISPPYASMILKDYPFIVIATSQGGPTASDSTNGIATVDFTPTVPTRPTGGLTIAVRPKTIYIRREASLW